MYVRIFGNEFVIIFLLLLLNWVNRKIVCTIEVVVSFWVYVDRVWIYFGAKCCCRKKDCIILREQWTIHGFECLLPSTFIIFTFSSFTPFICGAPWLLYFQQWKNLGFYRKNCCCCRWCCCCCCSSRRQFFFPVAINMHNNTNENYYECLILKRGN